MATQTYKQLCAAAGSGTIGTAANLYAASGTAGTSTIISSIVICNASGSAATYTIAINAASATYAAGRYVVYQATLQANETISLTLGIVLDPTNRYLNASSSSSSVNFSAYGVEIA
jgi:hypothetical protein